MVETLRRLDRGFARVEGWLLVFVLILMVLVAGFAAGVRNLTRFDIDWASELLANIEWADSLLRKGTMWLAFLGASLATFHKKHIIIDPLLRIAPPKAKYAMLATSTLIAGLLTFAISYSYAAAVYLNLTERPIEYELLSDDGESIHVCDAKPERIAEVPDLERPAIFCFFRDTLALISVPAETPGAAFQLIVPVMFFVIALRFMGQGLGYVGVLAGGAEAIEEAERKEREAAEAQAASLQAGSLPPTGGSNSST